MRTTVEDVHEGNRQDVRLLRASKIRDMSVKWYALEKVQSVRPNLIAMSTANLFSSPSLRDAQADTKNGIGTEVRLIR